MSGSQRRDRDPARARSSCPSPSPASTTSTTRSPRPPAASQLGHRRSSRSEPGSSPSRAAFGRAERIEVGARELSILLIKNPAGANEVFRTLPSRARRATDGLDLWIALNDRIADGRDISWIWDADFELLAGVARRVICSGTRAEELALRLKYAGIDEQRIEVAPGSRTALDRVARARTAAGRCTRCRPTPRCWSCATCSPPAATRAVLGMTPDTPRQSRRSAPIVWHDLECGAYSRRPRALARSSRSDRRAAPALRRARPRLRHRPRRASPCAAGGHRVTALDLDAALAAELRRRAAAAGRRRPAPSTGDVRDFDLGRRFDLVLAPMQLLQLLAGRERAAAALLERARAHLRPGGRFAAALLDLDGEPTDGDYTPPLPDMRELDGWVCSSQAVEVRMLDGGSGDRARPAAPARSRPTARWPRAIAACGWSCSCPSELEDELARGRARAGRAAPRSRRPRTTSAASW